jgi:hypothetical protein
MALFFNFIFLFFFFGARCKENLMVMSHDFVALQHIQFV